jgi:hypothetical protein
MGHHSGKGSNDSLEVPGFHWANCSAEDSDGSLQWRGFRWVIYNYKALDGSLTRFLMGHPSGKVSNRSPECRGFQ